MTNPINNILLAGACSLMLAGCTTLFDDDFEAYAPGASVGLVANPNLEAPGEIVVVSGDPELYRVQGGSAISGSQSLVLRFASQGPPNQGPVLSFVSDPPQSVTPQGASTTSPRPVYIVWSGRISAVSDGSTAIAEVWEGDEVMFVVGVNDERLTVEVGQTSQAIIEGDFTIGHRIFIRVDAGGYFGVEVSGNGGSGNICGGSDGCALSALPGPIDLPRLRLRMRTFEQVPQNDSYRVDAVRIFQRIF